MEDEQLETLGEQLYAQIHRKHKDTAGKLTGMLLELPVPVLTQMLQDEEMLTAAVEKALRALQAQQYQASWTSCPDEDGVSSSSDSLGEQLFELVDVYKTGQSEKITGMLLEQHKDAVLNLLSDPKLLEEQLNVSLKTLAEQREDVSDSSDADDMEKLGEKLFCLVEEAEPRHANDITGMLLEMEPEALQLLLTDATMLQAAVHKARAALDTQRTGGQEDRGQDRGQEGGRGTGGQRTGDRGQRTGGQDRGQGTGGQRTGGPDGEQRTGDRRTEDRGQRTGGQEGGQEDRTGNRGQGTGGQGTGDRGQEDRTGNRGQGTGGQRTGDRRTGDRGQGTEDRGTGGGTGGQRTGGQGGRGQEDRTGDRGQGTGDRKTGPGTGRGTDERGQEDRGQGTGQEDRRTGDRGTGDGDRTGGQGTGDRRTGDRGQDRRTGGQGDRGRDRGQLPRTPRKDCLIGRLHSAKSKTLPDDQDGGRAEDTPPQDTCPPSPEDTSSV